MLPLLFGDFPVCHIWWSSSLWWKKCVSFMSLYNNQPKHELLLG
jgi:hypothetical protein